MFYSSLRESLPSLKRLTTHVPGKCFASEHCDIPVPQLCGFYRGEGRGQGSFAWMLQFLGQNPGCEISTLVLYHVGGGNPFVKTMKTDLNVAQTSKTMVKVGNNVLF